MSKRVYDKRFRAEATKRVLEKLDNPPDMGTIREGFSIEDIY